MIKVINIVNSLFFLELLIIRMFVRITQYRINWLERLNRMDDCRIPNHLFHYKPKGREI